MKNIITEQIESLWSNQNYLITGLSNTSALLNQMLENINWVGFYLYQDGQLVLGPFQGKVACEIIPLNKGVCGKCATDKKSVLVYDVHQFPGHIACDSASNSELVTPIFVKGELWGLLDIDSPSIGRFTIADQQTMEEVCQILGTGIEKAHF